MSAWEGAEWAEDGTCAWSAIMETQWTNPEFGETVGLPPGPDVMWPAELPNELPPPPVIPTTPLDPDLP